MKKTTNRFRRCPNCPHSSPTTTKCCCQRHSTSHVRSKALTSRAKKEQSTILDTCSMSMVNSTIPTVVAECSALRTENNQLRKELLNVSTFLKDDIQTMAFSPPEPSMNEKLFLANKQLREALVEVDTLSKVNKELIERNTTLGQQCEGYKIQLREMEAVTDKYKRRCRKYSKAAEQQDDKAYEVEQLSRTNVILQEENRRLRDDVHCLKLGNYNLNNLGNLSPQWVAHTNNKGKPDQTQKVEELQGEGYKGEQYIKNTLADTIATLQQGNTHFASSCLEGVGLAQSTIELIQKLLEAYSDSVLRHFGLLMRESNRKLDNYQRKLNNLTNKWENLLMDVHNNRLRSSVRNNRGYQSGRKPLHDLATRA